MYQSIEDEVCRLLDLFEKYFDGLTFYEFTRPEIIYAPLTVDAGQCMYDFVEMNYVVGNLVFNTHMIPNNFIQYITVVAPHETAHWCTAIVNGYLNDDEQNVNHGHTWRQMMRFFEADPRPQIFDLHAPVVDGLHQFGCKCSTVNLDDQDIEMYELDLHCPNCNTDFRQIVKAKK
jgi:predicted SprT family Zn-dependent metalloprotease